MNSILKEEFFDVSRELQGAHSIFYKMWDISEPRLTDEIPTACIVFDKEGQFLEFLFNKDFWNKCSIREKAFVVGHECLHVILNHGERLQNLDSEIGNIAADLVVNHMLIDKFNFTREEISFAKSLCWIEKFFKKQSQIEKGNTLEYYYDKLKQEFPNEIPKQLGKLLDSHQYKEKEKSGSGSSFPKLDQETIDRLLEELSGEQNNSLKDSLKSDLPPNNKDLLAGSIGGSLQYAANTAAVKKKKKWETVIKKWEKKNTKRDQFEDIEQWARQNRRIACLESDIILPSDAEYEKPPEKDKIDVFFFQDTSGSCYQFANRFFKAAKTLDPNKFNIRLFCFDTRVYETSLSTGQLYGFGGTRFDIIEYKIKELTDKEKIKYPKAIFVITDGYGNYVYPSKPENWYWFLCYGKNSYATSCIPNTCNVFDLNEYE